MKGAIPGRWQAYQEEHSGSDTLRTAGLSASLSWIRLHAPLLFGRSQQTRPDFAPLLPGWSNPATECCGSWTAEGNYYVFQSRYDDQSNIWGVKRIATAVLVPTPDSSHGWAIGLPCSATITSAKSRIRDRCALTQPSLSIRRTLWPVPTVSAGAQFGRTCRAIKRWISTRLDQHF
jgi:hypothetical protein